MRQTIRAFLAGVSILSVLAGPVTVAQAADDASAGRTYPNVLAEAGYSAAEIDAKVDAAWQQLFHGAPGTSSDRRDGQSVYYQLTDDMAYVEDIGNQDVRSEGIGYAMMIAVQLDHQEEFDDLWNFARSKMQISSGVNRYLFSWHTDTTGRVLDTGIAPDGDEWIALALAFAANRWGNGQGTYDYRTQAQQIVRAMWHQSDSGGVNMFDQNTHLPYFSPPGAVSFTDPSYCLPAFYKVFAELVPEDKAQWDATYTATQQLLRKASHSTTGLYPSYSTFDGAPTAGWGGNNPDAYGATFQEDAWRAIANVNVDAAWHGTQSWHTELSNRLSTFFVARGVTSYGSRYRLDGTPVVNGQNSYEPAHPEGLVAMNSTMAISGTHPDRLEFVHDLWNTAIPSGRARYYDGLLYLLGLLYDSGKFRIW